MRMTSRHGAIGDLCIALAHRWEPERIFVILTAYLDESGTHGGDGTPVNPASPLITVGGIMGSAAQWSRFAIEAESLKQKYGFHIFHMKDFIGTKGEFRGWPANKKIKFIDEFMSIRYKMMASCIFRQDRKEYQEQMINPRPQKPQLDTEYGFCVRGCIYHFYDQMRKRVSTHKKWPKTKLHFVLEQGHKNYGDAVRIFNEIQKDFKSVGEDHLGPISFADKGSTLELMAADFLTTGAWMLDQIRRKQGMNEASVFGTTSNPQKSNLVSIRIHPSMLPMMRDEVLAGAAARRKRHEAIALGKPLALLHPEK